MRNSRLIFSRVVFSVVFLLSGTASADWYNDTLELMGTRVHIELWADQEIKAHKDINDAMTEIQRIDWLMNPLNPTSELYKINTQATGKPLQISAELYWIISKSLYYSTISEGAFDISFASIGQYYDYRQGIAPSEEEIASLRASVNYKSIKLDPADKTIFLAEPNMHLDLGGIAKGYAVDRAVKLLLDRGVVSAIVTAGGDSRIIGSRGERPWYIGIKNPRNENENAVIIPLSDTAISTSGDYERFFIKDGVRFHHILSPKTGMSVGHVQSVSILATLAVDSDALSTTVFILGVEKGLALVNSLEGIDAIIIDNEGKLHYSENLLMPEQ